MQLHHLTEAGDVEKEDDQVELSDRWRRSYQNGVAIAEGDQKQKRRVNDSVCLHAVANVAGAVEQFEEEASNCLTSVR